MGLGIIGLVAISAMALEVNDKNDVSSDTKRLIICFIMLRSSSVKFIIIVSPFMPGFVPFVKV